jgi:hypothetical protein
MMNGEVGLRIIVRTKWIGFRVVRGYNFGIPGIRTMYFELGYLQIKISWLNFNEV